MKSKANARDALMSMIQNISISFEMHIDGAKEENLHHPLSRSPLTNPAKQARVGHYHEAV